MTISRLTFLLPFAALVSWPALAAPVNPRSHLVHRNGKVFRQSNPNRTDADNYSRRGNVNPFTGQPGMKPGRRPLEINFGPSAESARPAADLEPSAPVPSDPEPPLSEPPAAMVSPSGVNPFAADTEWASEARLPRVLFIWQPEWRRLRPLSPLAAPVRVAPADIRADGGYRLTLTNTGTVTGRVDSVDADTIRFALGQRVILVQRGEIVTAERVSE